MFYLHSYSHDRAYLLTTTKMFFYTTDTGRSWNNLQGPAPPNTFGASILHFHPTSSDSLIWVGNENCENNGENCHATAYYSLKNGRDWDVVETYVRNCAWARDEELKIDRTQIICESYRDKRGNQRNFLVLSNPLQFVMGTGYFSKKTILFDRVVGFAKFSEFLIVAEVIHDQVPLYIY